MPQVVLIRPGCTDFDEQHRIQGALDLPLNSRGEEQVAHVVDQLRDVPLEVIFTAPGEPARSTAAAIGQSLGVPVKELERLRNLDQGLWQGLQVEDVRRKYPKVFKQWQESPETICPPEGETVDQALNRIRKALSKRLKRKAVIGIVVSEPLATLIRCVLQGRKPELPRLAGSDEPPALVETLHAEPRLGENGMSNGEQRDAPSREAGEPSDHASVDGPRRPDPSAPSADTTPVPPPGDRSS